MRVLLRDASTGFYYQEPGNWTLDTRSAKNFRHSADAMNLARNWGLQRAEVVLAFDEPDYAVALPLPASLAAAAVRLPAL